MIKNTVVQYIIIFVIFILGISIVSEWISNSVGQRQCKKRVHFQDEFEAFLEQLKQEMKQEYTRKVSQYLESRNYGVEHFTPTDTQASAPVYINDSASSPPVYIHDTLITPEESKIMAQLNAKIHEQTDYHASGRKTLGQVYNQIDQDTIKFNNLDQHFKTIPYAVKFNEEQKMTIPSKPNYVIDYTHSYTPSVKPEYPYNIPGSSGIAPQEKSYIFDDKYSVKNYQIKPADPYSSSYTILN